MCTNKMVAMDTTSKVHHLEVASLLRESGRWVVSGLDFETQECCNCNDGQALRPTIVLNCKLLALL